jgi:hypothetical protein
MEYFPRFPPELRIRIWRMALEQRQRIIKVQLRSDMMMNALLARQGTVRPETHKSEQYDVVVDGHQMISKLLRVSLEARHAALEFYRVHIPCWLKKGATTRDETMKAGYLYFNPEHDFLQINNDTGHVVEFLHDLKTVHDPYKVGLLNLAADRNDLLGGGGLSTIDPATIDPPLLASITETLSQLREVIFIHVQRAGRNVFGLYSGAPTHEYYQNLSFPVVTVTLNYDRLPRDPRPIGRDLDNILVNADPRTMVHAWRRLIYNHFGDAGVPETEHRIMLAFEPTAFEVYDCFDASEYMRYEVECWTKRTQSKSRQSVQRTSSEDIEGAEEEEVETVFGFWLFPVDAFGELPERPTDSFVSKEPRCIDMTNHWPELAVVNLS